MYNYWGFGLHITSEIEFPELLPADFEKPDVQLTLAPVPHVSGNRKVSPANFQFVLNDKQLLFEVAGVAKYFAGNGDTIIIEPDTGLAEMRMLRLFALATVFAGILIQRKQLPMHASAILHKNQLVLICGHSGAGKSTTLAGLTKKGCRVFSDDIVVVNALKNATASYPMIKLWEDAQDKLDDKLFADKTFFIKPGMNKYGIFFHQNFDTNSYPVKKVLILNKGGVDKIESKKVMDTDAFKELGKQVYRPILLHNNELQALKFNIISGLANSTDVYQVTRPAECNVTDLVEYVEKLIF